VRKLPLDRMPVLPSQPEGPLTEMICAENLHSFLQSVEALPIPQAKVPDF
jgi:hypothetical protein